MPSADVRRRANGVLIPYRQGVRRERVRYQEIRRAFREMDPGDPGDRCHSRR